MFKKIILVLAVCLLPLVLIGSEIGKDHWSYKDVKSLVDSGVITKPLTKDSLSRDEMVEYINNGVDNVLAANSSSSSGGGDLMDKINKLYNLVKAYMTDMARTEKKLDDVLETIGDLRVKKAEIEKKQDQLLNAMGLRINGESSMYMTDVLIFGSKLIAADDPAQRYRPITQFIDLKFSLQARKDLYAEATFRMENLFGGFFGSQDIYGLRRLFIQGDMPVSFIFGGYQAKITPFTLWANDEERPFEAKIFSDKRDMNKTELYLMDNTWPVNGGKIHTIVELFDALDLNILVMAARLGKANDVTTPSIWQDDTTYGTITREHDQYMIGGRISTDATLKEILEIGANYNEIVDSKDTGDATEPNLHNYVFSGDLLVDIKVSDDMSFKISGEYASSWYNSFAADNTGYNVYYYDSDDNDWDAFPTHQYAVGSAMKGGVEVNAFNSILKFDYLNVGNSFTAYAAQSRYYDYNYDKDKHIPYLTQNSTWNISKSTPAYGVGGNIYPFTQYNPEIMVNYGGLASTMGALISYPVYENNISPYGDATPNRNGFRVSFAGEYDISGNIIEPMFKYESEAEIHPFIKDSPRTFTVIQGGIKGEFGPLSVQGGVRMEDTKNDATGNSEVALASTIIDVGIDYQILKKKLLVYIGYKKIAFVGEEFERIGSVPIPTKMFYNHSIDSWGGGVEYKIAKPAVLGVYFTNTVIEDLRVIDADNFAFIPEDNNTNPTYMDQELTNVNSYSVQELGVKLSIFF